MFEYLRCGPGRLQSRLCNSNSSLNDGVALSGGIGGGISSSGSGGGISSSGSGGGISGSGGGISSSGSGGGISGSGSGRGSCSLGFRDVRFELAYEEISKGTK